MQRISTPRRALLACCCLATLSTAAFAETGRRHGIDAAVGDIGALLRTHFPAARLTDPAPVRHTLELPGRTLRFTAKAGAVVFKNGRGAAVADITYFAYLLDGAKRKDRPVTFAINGGPGSASAWLHIGGLGPWRLAHTPGTDKTTASEIVVNAETWLDFTDLVFIDAASTGFSRVMGHDESLQRTFFSFDGDIASLVVFVQRWLEAHGRTASPKVFLGESYSGLRAPHIANIAAGKASTAFDAVILVSPVLSPWGEKFVRLKTEKIASEVFDLPSMAATFAERRGEPALPKLAEFESYAMGAYRTDLAAQPRDDATTQRLVAGLAAVSGIEADKIRARAPFPRIATPRDLLTPRITTLQIEPPDKAGLKMVQRVEIVPISGRDFPRGVIPEYDLAGEMQQAAGAVAKDKFGWTPNRDYEMRGSSWSRTGLELMTPLMAMLARNPNFRALVTHGAADSLTPYFKSKMLLKPLLGEEPDARVALKVYEGGHIYYFREDSRVAFRTDGASFYEAIARGRRGTKPQRLARRR